MNNPTFNEQFLSHTIELHALLSIIFKTAHQSVEKRLALHATEMSRLQFTILMITAHEDPQTISELSRKIGVNPSTLVPSVDVLERKGLIARKRDAQDRRRVLLSLTEEGETFVTQIRNIGEDDPLVAAVRSMGTAEMHQLLTLLCKFVHHLPEGAEMMQNALPRIYAHGAKEEYLICTPPNPEE